ncbi:amidohydrolase [Clostridium tetanomorphum]|uniref:Amidohydrolase n=1 Tax=Clostridium tetanomorphum TaxID=1553 RepID=A0A923J2H4_CLOTT|nr:amidohydrolase [Clostridium tetanomorphum]KAJ48973.1 amidohydrolase [Clostridium tetanomorphum DSM 665]KAJ49764.1 amidohydrolase [Clostridium tetanomorphum DSM 665]MBC2399879.1 amidohydrolase [Clostridium tetanomorphum]MBP1866352.1 amidohydrolase [Clostridium tetanomorphum]NRS83246.1 amidohydrolase [Clostridium tetanomorphum]
MKTLELSRKYYDWMVELRRDFHKHPEESFKEFRTSQKIKEELNNMGIEVMSIGDTGVVGLLRGKEGGKVVALRADIDALSVNEETGLPYSSEEPGMMHACGHDFHASMLLGAAKILSEIKDEIQGSVKFIFQPAEEVAGGAKSMIQGGALENPKVDMIFGMHIWSDIPVGQVSLQSGPIMASADVWSITIKGKSCHGSSPWQGVDAITCATAVLQGLHTIVTRVNDVRNPIVINVGTINAGERFNVVPGRAEITGMNRTFTVDSRNMMPKWMEKMIKSTCEVYCCEYEFKYDFTCSPTVNDGISVNIAAEAVEKIVGKENMINIEKVMGSEDFSEYAYKVPAALMFLGGRNEEKKCCYSHHSNFFNVDEEALPIGAASYAQVALDFLNK